MTRPYNQAFQDWSKTKKFPFTQESDLTCSDGRRIPVSLVCTISLYPAIDEPGRLVSIDKTGMTFAVGNNWTGRAAYNEYVNGWIPIRHNGYMTGAIVFHPKDFPYMVGMSQVATMNFDTGHADLVPEVVRGFCLETDNVDSLPTFFGHEVKGMTFELDSERFDEVTTDIGVVVDMDVTAEYVYTIPPITKVKINNTEYDINPDGHFMIRCPMWCDTQIITVGDSLVLHQRGA